MGTTLKGSYRLGVDIGSTTVKLALLDDNDELIFSDYKRHFANIKETFLELVNKAYEAAGRDDEAQIFPVITGSGGFSLSAALNIPFNQEVIAVSTALKALAPQTDVAIELGGEDAKIIYFENGSVEQRMNGICAGGTGSFIDQMASLLQTDASGLNELAKEYKSIYNIAARCGVFAKSDIQPLINDGAAREDLAASIFQAVVNQTISGLAQGKPIRGHIAFLGGPLFFLSELRAAFIRSLKLDEEHTVISDKAHLFAAIGSALTADDIINAGKSSLKYSKSRASCHSGGDCSCGDTALDETKPGTGTYGLISFKYLMERLSGKISVASEITRLDPLFADEEDYKSFINRQSKYRVKTNDLTKYKGNIFLGIDAGSTTTKCALVDDEGNLLYSFYSSNEGNPIKCAIKSIREMYRLIPKGAAIKRSCSTGYGEALLKSALKLDDGEVETVAHFTAASHFDPDVDCILDIGGQDMKCIRIKNNTVDSVQLNEACSAGCGSFIETFARGLGFNVKDFAKEALFAESPIDLGTRCTVFMNSNVKQAQKEGAPVSDISAGLAYSVIKNALFKVIKVSDASQLGKNIVVQGGTFYNDAVLKALEKTAGCEVTRPDIAGIMGAYGAALIARNRFYEDTSYKTTMLPFRDIDALEYTSGMAMCGLCTNNCRLTVNKFSGGRQFVTGNRCERGLGLPKKKSDIPNLFEYKLKRVFDYKPLSKDEAKRGTVGIPRVLNIYENYPFWHTFFTKLGYRVVISPVSTRKIYEMGIESIPSESECYPAKIAHGHVEWLIQKADVDFIFYPSLFYERMEVKGANNHYNCPMVTSYSENIKNNVEEITKGNAKIRNPFMAFTDLKTVTDSLIKAFPDIDEHEIVTACYSGWLEMTCARDDVRKKGEETLKWMEENHKHGIVLAGRPYHIDPEIHHGIPEMIASYGVAVLTEDSISHLEEPERPLVVSDQWMYHSRLYSAAAYIRTRNDLDLIQLNSFGCGLDAVTTDQVQDILNGSDKIYTVLKIDEVNNLGAARIRVRSLLAAIRERDKKYKGIYVEEPASTAFDRVIFTKEMKENYTLLCPQMSPIHFDLVEHAFKSQGYNFVVMQNDNHNAIDMGLKYVNNDACYPSLWVVGQIMDELHSGKYDLNRVAVLMSQTGGGCRATNYIGFIRRALKKSNMEQVPVVSINMSKLEENPGFKLTVPLMVRAAYAAIFGDIFMKCVYRMRPYEQVEGSVNEMHEKWKKEVISFLTDKKTGFRQFNALCKKIIEDFDNIPITDQVKPRVGVVGEILVKFAPAANNHLVELLEREGAEAVVPDLVDFMQYCFYNQIYKADELGTSRYSALLSRIGIWGIDYLRGAARKAFEKSRHFDAPTNIYKLAEFARPIVSIGNQTGEGWFLTAEMVELIKEGAPNIVCTQPFGCLPNHIVGKGVIKELRRRYPAANVVPIDYDPGASEVNQLNRIKLMLTSAQRKITSMENPIEKNDSMSDEEDIKVS